jgi:aminopeptidase N
MNFRSFALFAAGLFLLGCNSSKQFKLSEPYEIRLLDTMVVTAYALSDNPDSQPGALPPYQASATREFDLIHTRLDLKFDWEDEAVIGHASLSLKPYFQASDRLVLDAKGFTFKNVTLEPSGQSLDYRYNGQQISIDLDRKYERTDTIQIGISYIAHPSEEGGSWAITSDKGLFFINPRGEETDKPRQIWTQGETENNSRWFPTIDKPNERCTQEMLLTVDSSLATLSNGVLVSSTMNNDGTRTDYWKMDQPHAPYLFMLAIGEYAVVEDRWGEIPLQYYVEPEWEDHAKAIFPKTPEMLDFFSNLLDYPYPWPKYSQVVVRDFVSGAMENTTAVIFGDFMYGRERELVDVLYNEKIVAHEMFHHWFGDLVTCESWSNLTLNEGFANYSEYLWLEHHHGKEEADYHLVAEWEDYIYEARDNAHPLIDYHYASRDHMFDRHSYNKGGMVMHMLRNYLGDEAFFAGLNRYLSQNAYSDVEADELRLALEDITGQDLNWFFDQWFFKEGHPRLQIDYSYDEDAGEVVVKVGQTQGTDGMPTVFQFPVSIQLFHPDGRVQNEKGWMREQKAEFRYPAPQKPELVLFDPDRILLCEREENKTVEDYITQYYKASNVRDRLEALQQVPFEHLRFEALLTDVLGDSYWALRAFALDNLEEDPGLLPKIASLARKDPQSQVRSAACYLLGQPGGEAYISDLEDVIDTDFSIYVVAAALDALHVLSPQKAFAKAEELEQTAEGSVLDVIADIYLSAKDARKTDFFRKQIGLRDEYESIYYMTGYLQLARLGSWNQLAEPAELLYDIALRPGVSLMKRYAAMRGLNDIHSELKKRVGEAREDSLRQKIEALDKTVLDKIESVKATETNEELRDIYKSFPNSRAK